MLAYQQGGAHTPTGAQGSASTPSGAQAQAVTLPVTNSAAAGMQSAAQAATIDRTQAETDRTKAETTRTAADTVRIAADTGRIDALKDQIRQEMTSFDKRMGHLQAQIRGTEATTWMHRSQTVRNQMITMPEIEKLRAEAARLKEMATLLHLDVPEAVNRAANQQLYSNYWQNYGPFVDQGVKLLNSAQSVVKQAITKGRTK